MNEINKQDAIKTKDILEKGFYSKRNKHKGLKLEIVRLQARGKSIGDMVALLERPYSLLSKLSDEIGAESSL